MDEWVVQHEQNEINAHENRLYDVPSNGVKVMRIRFNVMRGGYSPDRVRDDEYKHKHEFGPKVEFLGNGMQCHSVHRENAERVPNP